MTRLVLDPGTLNQLFPNASASNMPRLRLIGQVIEYVGSDLVLKGINKEGTTSIRTENVAGISVELGSIVSLTGFYDGENFDAIDCYELNGQALLSDKYQILEKIQNLKPLN